MLPVRGGNFQREVENIEQMLVRIHVQGLKAPKADFSGVYKKTFG